MNHFKRIFAILVMLATMLSPLPSFAHCHYHGPGYYHCHNDDDAFFAILILWLYGALLTTTTAHSVAHPAETLVSEAAMYLDSGEKGAVFLAYAKNMRTELKVKAEKEGVNLNDLTEEKIDQVIAENILDQAS
jgi:hypothetical protein